MPGKSFYTPPCKKNNPIEEHIQTSTKSYTANIPNIYIYVYIYMYLYIYIYICICTYILCKYPITLTYIQDIFNIYKITKYQAAASQPGPSPGPHTGRPGTRAALGVPGRKPFGILYLSCISCLSWIWIYFECMSWYIFLNVVA